MIHVWPSYGSYGHPFVICVILYISSKKLDSVCFIIKSTYELSLLEWQLQPDKELSATPEIPRVLPSILADLPLEFLIWSLRAICNKLGWWYIIKDK